MYSGLRCGELMALDWKHVDLERNRIEVVRSFDPKERMFITPKSRAGERAVPIVKALREQLIAQRLRTGRSMGLVFGPDGRQPFVYISLLKRTRTAWKTAGLASITLHECRHTFASLMIAAGVNPKALATFMGHSSIQITLDRYGHLFLGAEDEAAGMFDAFLERAVGISSL